ncbi:MAG: methylase [uncultured bacterium]|nr:MAG: methylase [uncultured bacterium]
MTDDHFLYIVSEKYNLCITVKSNGYIPKSGFLLLSDLENIDFEGKSVVDIGCGETGIIPHYCHARGAQSVTGIDVDSSAIDHVCLSSNVSSQIKWIKSDIFDNCTGEFDYIISNPPQMPMMNAKRKLLHDNHDSPGETGQEVILRILEESVNKLKSSGAIVLLIFDFLGVMESYNNKLSIQEFARGQGYICDVVNSFSKSVRKGGQTEANIPWIKKIYPRYGFLEDAIGNLYYKVLLVKFYRAT